MAVVDDDRDIFYLSKLKFNCHPEEYQVLPLFWLGKVQVKLCVNKKACHPSTPARKQRPENNHGILLINSTALEREKYALHISATCGPP
jgi:hypothetical protein